MINEMKLIKSACKSRTDECLLSPARSVPDISVQVVEEGERLRRKRPAKKTSFQFFCSRQMETEKRRS
jgi:hypothetical protein